MICQRSWRQTGMSMIDLCMTILSWPRLVNRWTGYGYTTLYMHYNKHIYYLEENSKLITEWPRAALQGPADEETKTLYRGIPYQPSTLRYEADCLVAPMYALSRSWGSSSKCGGGRSKTLAQISDIRLTVPGYWPNGRIHSHVPSYGVTVQVGQAQFLQECPAQ